MDTWLDEMAERFMGIFFVIVCLLGIVVVIALIYLIIYGALLTSYKYAEYKTADTMGVADMVKCLMTKGVYYDSTLSAEPLYEEEKPTLSFDTKMEFLKFCFLLKIKGHRGWADDLQLKYRQHQNKRIV